MEQKATIHVVDDDEAFVTAVSRLLRASGYAVRSYRSGTEFLQAKIEEGPGCILLDFVLPGSNGLDLQEEVARWPNPLPIIFLSGYADVPTSVRAIKSGATDFLTKPVKREMLLEAIRMALARDAEQRAVREQTGRWYSLFQALTPREREVFDRVVIGRLNKQIAAELGITERTVKAHRGQIMTKMRVDSVAQLVHIADQLEQQRQYPGRA